jgi:glycosyltransferase involved in cell wall biosynthesis
MKILYHHRIASKDGQYVHVEELTNALKELGHEINFVSPGFTDNTEFGNDGGIATKLKKLLPKSVYELLELAYSFVIAFKLIKQLLINRPDFIYERYNLYQPAGVLISRIFKIPLLLEINAPLANERKKYSGLSLFRLAKRIEKFTWNSADMTLPVTQVLADIISDSGVPKEKIEVIHNGINKHIFESVFRKKKERNKKNINIGFVGFINKWHRLDLAISAIADFPNKNINLICVGDGDIKPELEEQAKKLHIEDKVIFSGLQSRSEVFHYINNFDIALQPSVTAYASPLKLFEYLSSGCLIIAPRTKNICEILDDANALLFEPNNFNDFSEKLYYAIENCNNLNSLQIRARETIVEGCYTWQQNAEKVINIAIKIVNKNKFLDK